jgi:hypothetical protein
MVSLDRAPKPFGSYVETVRHTPVELEVSFEVSG